MKKSIARIVVGIMLFALSLYANWYSQGIARRAFDIRNHYGADFDVGRMFELGPGELAKKPSTILQLDRADRLHNFVARPLFIASILLAVLGFVTFLCDLLKRIASLIGRRSGPRSMATPSNEQAIPQIQGHSHA